MLITFALLTFNLSAHEQPRVVPLAEAALGVQPVSITAVVNPRSSGGPRDFSSEGDSWWPDPKNPNGPYIRRDGETNPSNFVGQRRLLFAFARDVGALADCRRRFKEVLPPKQLAADGSFPLKLARTRPTATRSSTSIS